MYLIYNYPTVYKSWNNNFVFPKYANFSNLYKTVEFGGREKGTFMQSCANLTRKDVILKMICFLDHSGQEFMPCCT